MNKEQSVQSALEAFTIDITSQAEKNKLDPVIGRDEEIRRAMQILQRRTKNNPILIGDPGVGKTAIVEGLAQRFVAGEVPSGLADCRILALDISSILSGSYMRGQFEERIKAIIKEVTESEGKYVLFIDEVHMLIGSGVVGGGSVDAANMLKPALARGELRCIGATTLDEYRKYIEKDPALERRFQRLHVHEPSIEGAISILRGLADPYSLHHGVRIADPALVAAVELSSRYVTDRFLPDKAIDLIDEAAAKLRIEQDSKPEELDRLEREITQLKLDREAIQKESDVASKKRNQEIKAKIKDIQAKIDSLNKIWKKEQNWHISIKKNKEKQEQLQRQLEQYLKGAKIEAAAKLKNDELPRLDAELKQLLIDSEKQENRCYLQK